MWTAGNKKYYCWEVEKWTLRKTEGPRIWDSTDENNFSKPEQGNFSIPRKIEEN